jgi:hypothetical protein
MTLSTLKMEIWVKKASLFSWGPDLNKHVSFHQVLYLESLAITSNWQHRHLNLKKNQNLAIQQGKKSPLSSLRWHSQFLPRRSMIIEKEKTELLMPCHPHSYNFWDFPTGTEKFSILKILSSPPLMLPAVYKWFCWWKETVCGFMWGKGL